MSAEAAILRRDTPVHGWLRARHISADVTQEFAALCGALKRMLANRNL